jgi:NADPH:quinone reductase-like Zn-dependent oxidoreductase
VGTAAIQIANWKQARVIGADRSSHPIPGTEAVIGTNNGDLREQVFDVTGGRGVDVVFDMVGGTVFEPGLRSLRLGGRYVVISSPGTSRVSFDLVDFYHNRAHMIGVDSNKFEPNELKMIMQELNRGFEAGALHAPELESAPFNGAISSYEKVSKGTSTKQILTF